MSVGKRIIQPGDRALFESAKERELCVRNTQGSRTSPIRKSADRRSISCPHCGRTWTVIGSTIGGIRKDSHGRAAGFVSSAAMNHAATCAWATPEERRAIARIDFARWQKSPPAQRIELDLRHPGYGNEPVFAVEKSDDQ